MRIVEDRGIRIKERQDEVEAEVGEVEKKVKVRMKMGGEGAEGRNEGIITDKQKKK